MTHPPIWDDLLDPRVSHRDAYADVAGIVRRELVAFNGELISTNALVDFLIGRQEISAYTRKRLYKALAALSTRGLADCVTKGEPVKRKFGMIRPNLWHKPAQATVCTGCGRPL